MTPASATLVIFAITGLNIVWDYPWLGMLSACVSMLTIGLVLNTWFRPKLNAWSSSAPTTIVDELTPIEIQVKNVGRVAAMNFDIAFNDARKSRGAAVFKIGHLNRLECGETRRFPVRRTFSKRGIYSIPDLQVVSHFPFGIFRYLRRVPIDSSIAVAPKPASEDAPEMQAGLNTLLHRWIANQVGGTDDDYAGAREYEVGMHVRRWDYRAWARLGKPIIRESNARSGDQVTILVDPSFTRSTVNSLKPSRNDSSSEATEHLFSIAMAAFQKLRAANIAIDLFVLGQANLQSSPSMGLDENKTRTDVHPNPLVRLASAGVADQEAADREMEEWFAGQNVGKVLLITTRHDERPDLERHTGTTVIRVDAQPQSNRKPSSRRRRASTGQSAPRHSNLQTSNQTSQNRRNAASQSKTKTSRTKTGNRGSAA